MLEGLSDALAAEWQACSGVLFASLRNAAVLALVFTPLGLLFRACNRDLPWWRKPDLSTDLCYAFLMPLVAAYARIWLLAAGIAVFFGLHDEAGRVQFFADGLGPLAGLPFWVQVAAYLIGADAILYATHRMFHTASLWRWHAVHHSSEQLEWVSASRFHPLDVVLHSTIADAAMLLMGVSPGVLVWLAPFNVGMSALVHANLDWDFGPFRYVLASPVFHRWHHTGPDRGGESNFAATFPVFDLLFGTFYMPRGERPDGYGVDDRSVPDGFVRQLLHPFRR